MSLVHSNSNIHTRKFISVESQFSIVYLHEESKKCVMHCDIKSTNVMLDSKCNAMLGDFGAAMFLDQPDLVLQTRKMVGTVGYVAPGFYHRGRAGKEADVYSFGVLVLEIACGIKKHKDEESHLGLVEWAWELYGAGNVLEAAGERLNMDFNMHEMEYLLIVG
ncbi:hypothetical protein NC652_015706 [Populus alba x Populus x berolinensis]|nr:hypothetical protein NC652_015706 [Populus alba x Populus x berolinensis]